MNSTQYARHWLASASLEELVTSRHFFGLTTASPVQRAFCRVVDGEPMGALADDAAVMAAFGGVLPPGGVPREVSWLSAIRTAKSLIAGAICVRMSQRADLSQLGPGEVARIPVLSLDKDKAQAVLNHLIGRVMASPMLRMLVIDKPSAEGILLRHPTGRRVEAIVTAGKRAGSAVVAYWLASTVFDEFPRMAGADDAVVNWDESRAAARGRILPGGLILNIGSPWAPEGPAYTQATTHFGKPTRDLVVMRSTGAATNPSWWTPERVAEDERTNPNHRTDCLAEFATPEEALFSSQIVADSIRTSPLELPPRPGAEYAAAMDPATRGNGWTLVLVTREGEKLRVALACEWIGTRDKPLDPGVVLDAIRVALEPYGVSAVATDQHMGDALERLARDRGLSLTQWTLTDAERTRRYLAMRTRFAMSHIEIPAVEHLRTDMIRVKRRVTQSGVSIVLPLTSDGRHCDYAPAMMLALSRYLDDVKPAAKDEPSEVVRMREETMRRFGAQRDEDD